MSELRQDRTTGAWVIIAPERGLRPHELSCRHPHQGRAREFEPACPFCPGNESQLPGILEEKAVSGSPGWQVRVVPNKYSLVRPATGPVQRRVGHHVTMLGRGQHEVVIESPRHDADLASMTDKQIGVLVSVYRERFTELIARPGIEAIVLFRNHGPAGGASLPHPHSQLVALGMTPPRLRSMTDWMHRCWDGMGQCVTCDELKFEMDDGCRIVEETQSYVALVPFAAAVPFEVWLAPKRHQGSFAEIDKTECSELGSLLRNTLHRLKSAHDDPPYNFMMESFDKWRREAPYTHWRLRIAPNLVTWGGFELGTGIPVNPSSPEADAETLRTVTVCMEK